MNGENQILEIFGRLYHNEIFEEFKKDQILNENMEINFNDSMIYILEQ